MTNTGPIIGGTRDGEQHSWNGTDCKIPVMRQVSITYDPGGVVPFEVVDNYEQLHWVPFRFITPDRQVETGFWVSLCADTRNLNEDSEYRLYVLMKLSERYIETFETHYQRHLQDHENGRAR